MRRIRFPGLTLFTTILIQVLTLLGIQAECAAQQVDLRAQIGQMILVGFRGFEVNEDSPIARDIREYKIGGVILFDYDVPLKSPVRNIESRDQIKALTDKLRSLSEIPLFIAIDQEGGRVNRLKEKYGFPKTVSAQEIGSRNDLDFTAEYARQTASLLRDLGINLNCAPVLDLNLNPDNPVIGKIQRSFSADPETVSRHAEVWIEAHRKRAVVSAVKHFPGHGSSREDSHLGLVDVSGYWSRRELEPYSSLIRSGSIELVMTAHIFNQHLDPDYPATLSTPVISGILRKELGFDGVVISDDMQMKAISSHYGLETAIEKAILAGVDILVFANNSTFDPQIAEKVVRTVEDLVTRGRISEDRINSAYQRILRLKKKIAEWEE